MKYILKFFFPILLLLSVPGKSQDTTWVRGIRLGCDLSRFALPFIQPERKAAVEFSIDTEWKPNFFPTGELGFENLHLKNDYVNYKSNGIYARIGYDKNILKTDVPQYHDMFFYGYRYSVSVMHQEMNSFTIVDTLWGKYSGNYSSSLPGKVLHTHWVELVFGTRASFSNFIYLGFTGRIRLKLYGQKDDYYTYIVPGFGKGDKILNFGFNYSIYFQVPVKKMKIKPVTETK